PFLLSLSYSLALVPPSFSTLSLHDALPIFEAGLRRGRRDLFLDRREGLGEVAHLFEAAGRVFGVPEHCAVPGGVRGAEPEGPEFTRFDEQVAGVALVVFAQFAHGGGGEAHL